MIEYRIAESIRAFGRGPWDALFPDDIERYDYLLATEQAGIEGFQWRYMAAEEDGRLLAAAPAFITAYPLDTTLTGSGKRVVAALRRLAPGALTLRLACIGSPCTETLPLGFADTLPPQQHGVVLAGLLQVFEAEARGNACGLLGLKDTSLQHEETWRRAACAAGYSPVPGLPVAALDVTHASLEEYLADLSAGTRRDMRRKLRARGEVRVEWRREIDDVLDEVFALYADTRGRADMQLEELTPAWFRGVLAQVPGARCALYYAGGRLLAANLLIQHGHTLLDKFFCMNAAAGRAYNLYFLSWFTNVEYCIANGLTRYQSGQAGYTNKLRLGSTLSRTSMYFRHSNRLVNGVLRAAVPFFTGAADLQQTA